MKVECSNSSTRTTVTGVPSQTITSTEKIQDCGISWQSDAHSFLGHIRHGVFRIHAH
jgi:hypothetical protein